MLWARVRRLGATGGIRRRWWPGSGSGRLQRRPVLEAIAGQARERAAEVAGWGLERSWPLLAVAGGVGRRPARTDRRGGLAGRPAPGRCTATITRGCAAPSRATSATTRPRRTVTPPAGSARCCTSGRSPAPASCPADRGRLRYAVGALDQLSRRMRAIATADSTARRDSAAERARRRREPAPRALQLTSGRSGRRGCCSTSDGNPMFDRLGMLRLDPDARYVPPVGSDTYRMVVRDAYLLAGRLLPVDVDGRKQMALRHQRQIPPAEPAAVRSDDQREVAELAHRTGQPLGRARTPRARLPPGVARAPAQQKRRSAREPDVLAFKAQLQRITDERRHRWRARPKDGGSTRRSTSVSAAARPSNRRSRSRPTSPRLNGRPDRSVLRAVHHPAHAAMDPPGGPHARSDRSRSAVARSARPDARPPTAPPPSHTSSPAASSPRHVARCCSSRPRATCRVRCHAAR